MTFTCLFTGCPIGTYGPQSGQASSAACLTCPTGTNTTSTGTVSLTSCLCNAGTIGSIRYTSSTCQSSIHIPGSARDEPNVRTTHAVGPGTSVAGAFMFQVVRPCAAHTLSALAEVLAEAVSLATWAMATLVSVGNGELSFSVMNRRSQPYAGRAAVWDFCLRMIDRGNRQAGDS